MIAVDFTIKQIYIRDMVICSIFKLNVIKKKLLSEVKKYGFKRKDEIG